MSIEKLENKSILRPALTEFYPYLSGDDVINNVGKELTQKIRDVVSTTKEVYQDVYLNTLYRFSEFCQAMPENQNASSYSLLTHQLKLAIVALKIRRGLLLPKEGSAEEIAKQDPQWTYAIFSASLFYQLDQIQRDRQIHGYDAQKNLVGTWQPLESNRFRPNHYYAIEWKSLESTSVSSLLSILASNIIPKDVITWISTNTSLSKIWWDSVTNPQIENPIITIIQQVEKCLAPENGKPQDIHQSVGVNNDQTSKGDAVRDNDLEANSPLSLLFNFLSEVDHSNSTKHHCLRVESGLLITSLIISQFLQTYAIHFSSEADFIKKIRDKLIYNLEQYQFSYRPKTFEDRRILEGIVIKEEHLPEDWKQKPIDTDFIPTFI